MAENNNSLFDQDRVIWVYANRITDVLLVAILWFIFSLPVVTIGASSTAAYYVLMKMARHEEGYIWKNFWKSFKLNFVQATILWIIQALLLAGLVLSAYYYYIQESQVSAGIYAFLFGIIIIVLIVCIYLPPIVCRFSNTTMNLLKMAIFLPFKNKLWTLALFVMFAAFAFLAWFIIPFVIVAYGVYAYCSSFIFVKIFKPFEKAIIEKNINNSTASEENTEAEDGEDEDE